MGLLLTEIDERLNGRMSLENKTVYTVGTMGSLPSEVKYWLGTLTETWSRPTAALN